MTEAWMKRGAERQELLQSLKYLIGEEEEKESRNPSYLFDLAEAFIEWLDFRTKHPRTHRELRAVTSAQLFLRQKIMPQIMDFGRTTEEVSALMAELFEWVSQSLAEKFKLPLRKQEIASPVLLFEGHQAMDEVE